MAAQTRPPRSIFWLTPVPPCRRTDRIDLVRVKRTNLEYQDIRNRHYVANRGCHGQQLHYLIKLNDETVGIISGASSVWAVAARDTFFGLTKENRRAGLPSIVNNVVFRLERHTPNLATRVLALWRKHVSVDWQEKYNVEVHGFETFVVESDIRKGALYRADNWTFLGETAGNTKAHKGLNTPSVRVATSKKLIFAVKVPGTRLSTAYVSTWRKGKVPPVPELTEPRQGG